MEEVVYDAYVVRDLDWGRSVASRNAEKPAIRVELYA